MKKVLLTITLGAVCAASACQQSASNESTTANANSNTGGTTSTTAPNANSPAPAHSSAPIKFPVADFPATQMTAKAGEFVLAPEYKTVADASLKGLDSVNGPIQQWKMETPGAELSEVSLGSEKQKMPNQFMIPIPAGQTVKKGDIVLTAIGAFGMQRALVIADTDPTKPTVAMLDYTYPETPTEYNSLERKLEPNTFVKISGDFAPGTSFYVKDGAYDKVYKVISTSGEKILGQDGTGFFKAFDKKDCKPIPFVINVKPGDKVRAELGFVLAAAVVTKVDPRLGRVWVVLDNESPNKLTTVLGYGRLMKS